MCVSVFVVCAQILMRNFNSEEIKLAKTTKIQTQRKIFVFFLYLINKKFLTTSYLSYFQLLYWFGCFVVYRIHIRSLSLISLKFGNY